MLNTVILLIVHDIETMAVLIRERSCALFEVTGIQTTKPIIRNKSERLKKEQEFTCAPNMSHASNLPHPLQGCVDGLVPGKQRENNPNELC